MIYLSWFMLMSTREIVLLPSLLLYVPACSHPIIVLFSPAAFPLCVHRSSSSGGAGYIGSHTCVELIKAGEKVSPIIIIIRLQAVPW